MRNTRYPEVPAGNVQEGGKEEISSVSQKAGKIRIPKERAPLPFLSLPSLAMLPYPCALRLSHGLPLLRNLPSFLALPFLLTIRLLPVFPALLAPPVRLLLRDFGPGLSLPGKRPPSGSCGAANGRHPVPAAPRTASRSFLVRVRRTRSRAPSAALGVTAPGFRSLPRCQSHSAQTGVGSVPGRVERR